MMKLRIRIEVEGRRDVDVTDAVVECKKMVGQEDLDVVEVMDVLMLLEVVERCLEGTEDVANPNDVEHAVDDVLCFVEDVVDVHLVHDGLLSIAEDYGAFVYTSSSQ